MKPLTLILFAPLLLAACAHHTRPAPALTEPAVQTQTQSPPQQSFLSRTADTTWTVVSAPARLLPKKAPPTPKEPSTYETPEAIIITPDNDLPTTQPK